MTSVPSERFGLRLLREEPQRASYRTDQAPAARMLQGMTALADFLPANLERATGRDGQAFIQAVADQADRYFPN